MIPSTDLNVFLNSPYRKPSPFDGVYGLPICESIFLICCSNFIRIKTVCKGKDKALIHMTIGNLHVALRQQRTSENVGSPLLLGLKLSQFMYSLKTRADFLQSFEK